MNMIEWGMLWHNQLRNLSTTETATVKHIGGTVQVPVTKIDPESLVNAQGHRVQSEHFLFMFNTKDIERIRFTRGVLITHDGFNYEVVFDRDKKEEFDDPTGLTTNVMAKRCL